MSTRGAAALLALAAALAAPSAARAATSCSFDQVSGVLGVELAAPADKAWLVVAEGQIVVIGDGQVSCSGGTPAVNTTSVISVVIRPGAIASSVVIAGASQFGPGVGDENGGTNEIEIFVNLRDQPDAKLYVSDEDPAGASIRFGTGGINPNAFASERLPDADIFPINVPPGGLIGLGGTGSDLLSAQGGAGTGNALTAPVLLRGDRGVDGLLGGDGADTLFGDAGNDALAGGAGDDVLAPGPANDVVDGGPGRDVADFADSSYGVSVDLSIDGRQETGGSGSDLLAGIENVFGTDSADVLRGDGGPNRLLGYDGDDLLEGRGGSDVLEGSAGADRLDVRDGGPDSADCGAGIDTVSTDHPAIDSLLACENVVPPTVTPTGGGNPAPGGPPTSSDALAPAFLGRVRAVPARFTVRRRPKPPRAGSALGTTFRYSLSEAATVTFAISRATSGRKVKGRCRTETRSNARRPNCRRFTPVGSFEARATAGPNRTRFSGLIATTPLEPGAYRALLSARDAAGNSSRRARANFKVVRTRRSAP